MNAVLRAAARGGDGPERFPDPTVDPAGYLTTWGSHPRWLGRWPFDEVRQLVELDNRIPRLHLVPLDPGGLDEAADRLRREPGVEVEVLAVPGVLRVSGIDPRRLLETVPGFVQDPAAALVCRYAAVPPDTLVALLAEIGRYYVPCSGTGTLGRHPDARWRLSPTAPGEMARVQARILRKAAGVVPPGGMLVYSTCTLEPEENLGVVEVFLGDHPDFRWSPPEDPELDMNDDGWMEVLPQRTGFDGAFAVGEIDPQGGGRERGIRRRRVAERACGAGVVGAW